MTPSFQLVIFAFLLAALVGGVWWWSVRALLGPSKASEADKARRR